MTREELRKEIKDIVEAYGMATSYEAVIHGVSANKVEIVAEDATNMIMEIIDDACDYAGYDEYDEDDFPEDTEFCPDGFVSEISSDEDFAKIMQILFGV